MGWWRGAETVNVKNRRMIQLKARKNEWKNAGIWKAKGKAMDTSTGESPGYQTQSQ